MKFVDKKSTAKRSKPVRPLASGQNVRIFLDQQTKLDDLAELHATNRMIELRAALDRGLQTDEPGFGLCFDTASRKQSAQQPAQNPAQKTPKAQTKQSSSS